MNRYKAFGLVIESEIVFHELIPYDGEKSDIIIINGKVPEALEDIVVEASNIKICKDKYWLDIENVARYYVEKGELIIMEPYKNACFEEIKLYVLGSCIGAALYQRRMLPLHGSFINVEGKGLLLTGESGVGKSTIAAVMLKKGFKMLTDDVAAVVLHGLKGPTVYPGYPSQKLWEDAIERIGIVEEKKVLNRVNKDLNKYSVMRDKYFDNNPIPIKVIIEITSAIGENIKIEEITGAGKLEVVLKNTYRKILIEAMDLREWYFNQCVNISEKIVVYRVTRPLNKHLENEIASLIMEKIV